MCTRAAFRPLQETPSLWTLENRPIASSHTLCLDIDIRGWKLSGKPNKILLYEVDASIIGFCIIQVVVDLAVFLWQNL